MVSTRVFEIRRFGSNPNIPAKFKIGISPHAYIQMLDDEYPNKGPPLMTDEEL